MDIIDVVTATGAVIIVIAALKLSLSDDRPFEKDRNKPEQEQD